MLRSSGIAVQHADDSYARCVKFDGVLVRNMVLMYSPDGSNVYGSIGGELRGTGSVQGVERRHFIPTCSDTLVVGCIV